MKISIKEIPRVATQPHKVVRVQVDIGDDLLDTLLEKNEQKTLKELSVKEKKELPKRNVRLKQRNAIESDFSKLLNGQNLNGLEK